MYSMWSDLPGLRLLVFMRKRTLTLLLVLTPSHKILGQFADIAPPLCPRSVALSWRSRSVPHLSRPLFCSTPVHRMPFETSCFDIEIHFETKDER